MSGRVACQLVKNPFTRKTLLWGLMRAQRLFYLDLKQAYAIVPRIHNIKAAACVNPHAGWMAEICAFDCAWIKPVERLPFVTEDLNLVKIWVTDIYIALLVYR